MRFFANILPITAIILSGCGGGDPAATTGATTPVGPPTSTGTAFFSDPLALSTAELASLRSYYADKSVEFQARNLAPALGPSNTPNLAEYDGAMIARMGSDSSFLTADVDMTVDFANQTMSGRLDHFRFDGVDNAGQGNLDYFDQVVMSATEFSGSRIKGTMQGVVEEGTETFIITVPDDTNTVNANFEVQFVDTNNDPVGSQFAGTVDGTVTSAQDGTLPLKGVMSGTGIRM